MGLSGTYKVIVKSKAVRLDILFHGTQSGEAAYRWYEVFTRSMHYYIRHPNDTVGRYYRAC